MDLLLLRHAKSSWEQELDDHDRPLAPRGERAAALIGAYLAQRDLCPSLVLCSSARRAIETVERFLPMLPGRPEVLTVRDLYLAGPERLEEQIHRVDAGRSPLMLVAHHPGLQELSARLAGRGDPSDLQRMRSKFPTAGLAVLHFSGTDWRRVSPGGGDLRAFTTPKELV